MKISIVTVTYKNNHELISTLNSIFQTLDPKLLNDIEIIIIDGAADPKTLSLVKDIKKDMKNIILISEKDKGIYDGMNKGIEHASGEHTIFMNSGDLFKSDTLNSFMSVKRDINSLYYGNVDFYTDNDFSFHFKANMRTKKQFLRHNCFSHQAIFYPSMLIKELMGYDLSYSISADFDLTWRCYIKGVPFIHLNTTLANCSLGGVSCKNGLISYKDRYRCFKNSKHHLYATILLLYYPGFFAKNRIVMLLEGHSLLKFYRKFKRKLLCQK
ncbi:glycosyltransferase [Providencia rettgeri]|uniref:Glycosyltransferase n=1 Tax=Providencia rettgeri TaxID=587 RepID=A0AAP2JX45_PRORE|nr:glycosyltransferase [Providencia rettgeri]MBX6958032.1 glycosyltransferase [Providencia rettgeri]MBX6960049.1 glycosyltransferase [Providencia rettgeri]MBX6974086.1 glycosyltransferase [Providencia rettgeri]MBX6979779.1 glycosyltransferase [Providencia rettgeri]MBX6986975.1 glycosyltransferase [Providencia rettgeri]